MIDAVLTFHQNPQTCGVAKWNHALAQRLKVPVAYIGTIHAWKHPLVSIKVMEGDLSEWFPGNGVRAGHPYSLFLHDWRQYPHYPDMMWLEGASTVIAGNRVIAEQLRRYRPDVIEGWCPSSLAGDASRAAYNVLAFGMAHKLSARKHFRELKWQLASDHPDYMILLSTAVHEGSPWSEEMRQTVEALRDIFDNRLRVLGYLGDDALAKELQECDAVAVFFDPAVRENNTSVWAALNAGKKVYTNFDEHSPVLDANLYSWERLLDVIQQDRVAAVQAVSANL